VCQSGSLSFRNFLVQRLFAVLLFWQLVSRFGVISFVYQLCQYFSLLPLIDLFDIVYPSDDQQDHQEYKISFTMVYKVLADLLTSALFLVARP